jgi:CRISPR-associated protein Csb1
VSSLLTYDTLKTAVGGSAAAFRLTLRLEAVSPKVFPPTYEGGKYATEERIIGGQKLPCVLLDSVPSQANRMEEALQQAIDYPDKPEDQLKLPLTVVDFGTSKEADKYTKGIKITSLQAPHRIADAILRDSAQEGTDFPKTEIGIALDQQVRHADVTPLLKFAPHCLVFGMWFSTGSRGGLGAKFQRAMVSEIIGVNAVPGVTTGSRLDPLGIQKLVDKEEEAGVAIYRKKGGGWTLNKSEAETKSNKPVLYGKKGKPSEINHGNVTPDIVYRRDKNRNLIPGDAERPVMMVVLNNEDADGHKYVLRDEKKPIPIGGFTIEYAEQTTVLSLPALRRLRFPAKAGDKSTSEGDVAARTYLSALGLLAATLAVEAGYDLRSRCVLRAKDAVVWHLLGKPGDADTPFTLDKATALKLYADALAAVQKAKLPIHLDEITLTPSADLVQLVKKSMELAAAEAGDGGDA